MSVLDAQQPTAIVSWVAGLGAVTADALALCAGITIASARARLLACERAGMLVRRRVLADEPALYTATASGLRECKATGVQPCRVTAANATHTIATARVAATLARTYPDRRIVGERELRRDERAAGRALASAEMGRGQGGTAMLHRPDLAMWPAAGTSRPLAVEVELTVKSPRRLVAICRAWARCRCIDGVLYLAAPEVLRPLARAVEAAGAGERVAVVVLEDL